MNVQGHTTRLFRVQVVNRGIKNLDNCLMKLEDIRRLDDPEFANRFTPVGLIAQHQLLQNWPGGAFNLRGKEKKFIEIAFLNETDPKTERGLQYEHKEYPNAIPRGSYELRPLPLAIRRRRRMWLGFLAMALLAGLLLAESVRAAHLGGDVVAWTNESGDRDWYNAQNWVIPGTDEHKVPGAADDAVIGATPYGAPVLSGGTARVERLFHTTSGLSGLKLTDGATLTVIGPGASSFSGERQVEVLNGSTLALNGDTTWSAGVWGLFGDGGPGTVENRGRLSITGDVSAVSPGLVHNLPGATISSSGTAMIHAPLDNDGTLTVDAGTLTLAGGTGDEISAGRFVIEQGAELSSTSFDQRLSQGTRVTGAGTLRLTSHTFELVGDGGDCLPGTTLVSGGRLDLGGGGCHTGRLTSDGRGGGISNSTLGVGDGASRLDSIQFDNATVIFVPQATIAATGGVTVRGGSILALHGTTTWSAGNWQVGGPGVTGTTGGTVENYGRLSISGNTRVFHPGGGVLQNRFGGAITREGSSGTAAIDAPLYNFGGMVTVQIGTLATTDVEQAAGEITVAGSATLGASPATTLTLTGGTLSGSGTIRGWNWPHDMRHIWEARSPHLSCSHKPFKTKV
jgi:hypothetical protein